MEVRGAIPHVARAESWRRPPFRAERTSSSLDTADVIDRIEALPEVRRADVVRELPNQVVISVEERRPFTLVHGGRLHWMDEEGRLLGASPSAVSSPLPVISGLTADELASMRTLARAEGPDGHRGDPRPPPQRRRRWPPRSRRST